MQELLGTWTLESYVTEDLESHQATRPYGAHPTGYLNYGPDGRMYAILVHENRKTPASLNATDAESVELYRGLAAYAGTYSLDGDSVSHHVDISWNETWTGTTQLRQFKIDGNCLRIQSTITNPLTGRASSYVLVWRKIESVRPGGSQ
jgi:Lipocalin-like domain